MFSSKTQFLILEHFCCCSVVSNYLLFILLFSHSVVSSSLWPYGLQHTRLPWSLLRLTSIESMMPSNHLILCHPLLFLPSIFPSIRACSSDWSSDVCSSRSNLPHPGIKPASPALAGGFYTTEPLGKPSKEKHMSN